MLTPDCLISTYCFNSPFGRLQIGETKRGICSLIFVDSEADADAQTQRLFPKARVQQSHSAQFNVAGYFDNPKTTALPLDMIGTEFQQSVWQALNNIPFGEVRSYQEIARAIGKPTASRAVANACGANKISILIPCHRVVATGGGLGGYHWGEARKKQLLAWEASLC